MMKFKTIPPRVFDELESLAKLNSMPDNPQIQSAAALQLAFCYSTGWGTEKNPALAVEHLNLAAKGGSKNAMELSARFPAAFGYNTASREEILPWLHQCARQGSRVAERDFTIMFPQEAKELRAEKIRLSRQHLEPILREWLLRYPELIGSSPSRYQKDLGSTSSVSLLLSELAPREFSNFMIRLHNNAEACASYVKIVTTLNEEGDTPLLVAVKVGDFELARLLVSQMEELGVSQRDTTGATPLHWLSLFPFSETEDIVDMLLNAGLDPYQATTANTQVAGADYFLSEIAAGSTALDWATENDNVELVQYLVARTSALNASPTVRFDGVNASGDVLACAARYYSHETIRALCPTLNAEAINKFDTRGFSAFYYSVRPNLFERILRFVPGAVHAPSRTARNLEIEAIKMLLEVGSNMEIHKENFFNCLHVLASVDDVDIFKVVLEADLREGDPQKRLMNSYSNFRGKYFAGTRLGRTPLDVSIKEGNVHTVKLLLDAGADPAKCQLDRSSKGPVRHALHICAYAPWESAVPLAELIVGKDPSSVHAIHGFDKFTPLHEAAWAGQRNLIRFLLSNGSDLTPKSTLYTPLGAAIASRSITGVRVLAQAHHDAKKGLVATLDQKSWRFSALIYVTYCSAIMFLLNPGVSSFLTPRPGDDLRPGDEQSKLGASLHQFGCLDYPFSQTSRIILDILLRYYDKADFQWYPFATFWKQDIYPWYSSGLPQAVRLADLELFKMLIKSGKFNPDYDFLVNVAVRQFIIMDLHISNDDKRVEMTNYLRHLQVKQFNSKWDALRSISHWPLRYYWRIQFHIWAQPKQRLANRIWDGLVSERMDEMGDPWRGRWNLSVQVTPYDEMIAVPIWLVTSCMTWFIFLVPMVITSALAARDPASQWSGTETGKLVGVVLLVSYFPTTPPLHRLMTPI
jgi:ankyrin repeat protein